MESYKLIATTVDGQEVEIEDIRIVSVDLANSEDIGICMEFNQKTKMWETKPLEK